MTTAEQTGKGASGAMNPGQSVTVVMRGRVVFMRPRGVPGDRPGDGTFGGTMVKVRLELFGSRGWVEGQYIETWVPLEDLLQTDLRGRALAAALRIETKSISTRPPPVRTANPSRTTPCSKSDHGPQVIDRPCPKCGFQWGVE